ncbi:glutamate-1-semialdehyde 2,1-aminomutase [Pseudosulfitobacter pseudonitzschiae]|uniref:Aminotransferase n=1 Tax=Pseudosulfitobacter pseudonitzschiae TaxID=1402135 RepID=A0A073IZV3_9RHOB|nr:transaminase [Pseudosulfitobacter pseudonitzschiae]KEJ95259.1 aminotransferase [Pseudosulfitobacter pseudonitzschiae]SHF92557.1 glutamate-1-semialdehyde 2,1-aminomutase [Pseudosulfitobacter pseudonitzschiae]
MNTQTNTATLSPGLDVAALCENAREMVAHEAPLYEQLRPRSKDMFANRAPGFYDQVPQHWMRDWPMPFPFAVAGASGSTLTDIDGNTLVDFCLGDTGAMFGHAPRPIVEALSKSGTRGLTTMLPSGEVAEVGKLLTDRFGPFVFQIATTASDANRFAIRVARAVTGRNKILVFDGCYHGAVDETLVDLEDGQTVARKNLLGQVVDVTTTTVSIPFNDIDALKTALEAGDIAVVLAEPVMTNCGMILPDEGYLTALRDLTRAAGTLLHIDETHTISTGLGGYTAVHGLDPDIFVVGKPVGGGVPVAIWGMSQKVAKALSDIRAKMSGIGHSGIGTTLSGSTLQIACLRACLSEVMTAEAYATMNRHADRLEQGFTDAIRAAGLPWHVSRVGARLEIVFSADPVRNAAEARAAAIDDIQHALHIGVLNQGYLVTPFHNMVLVAPTTTDAQVEGLLSAYENVLTRLVTRKGK